jgi:transcription antitermination factor NusG
MAVQNARKSKHLRETSVPEAMDAHWYALQVKFRHEKAVAGALRGKGYEEFLPLYRGSSSAERPSTAELPLFPTYVFCKFDPLCRLPVLQTPGVFSIVSAGNTLLRVDEDELAAVRATVASRLPLEPLSALDVGDEVFVEKGPLRGTTGILQRFGKRDRLVISVTLLQRAVAVEIERSWVRHHAMNRTPAIGCR